MLTTYLVLKENFSGAAVHLHKVLELDPTFPNGQEWMKSLKCKHKVSASDSLSRSKPYILSSILERHARTGQTSH